MKYRGRQGETRIKQLVIFEYNLLESVYNQLEKVKTETRINQTNH